MQFTDVWLVISQMMANTAGDWWLDFWFRWLVHLAFGYTVLLLFAVILRTLLPSLPAKDHQIGNTLSWIVSLSLLLIIPSLLVRLLPGLALRVAGFDSGLESLQQLSFANLDYLVSILRHLSLQGGLGTLLVLVVSGHPATWRLILKGTVSGDAPASAAVPTPAAHRNLPQVQIVDELTPLPIETAPTIPSTTIAPREPSPLPSNMTADEVTLIPSPPLPLAAWLRSVSYKGGNNQIFELTVSETDIGRQTGHITLDADFSVSSNHAIIRYTDGVFYLTDRSRYQSTWINGIQVEKEKTVPLHDGDSVRFGESKFVFSIFRWPKIEFIAGPDQGKVIANQPTPILIGSGEHTHIVLKEEGIAEVYARIELDHQRKLLLLRPENSADSDGIQVLTNSTPLPDDPPWPLPANSQIQIGSSTLKINLPGATA